MKARPELHAREMFDTATQYYARGESRSITLEQRPGNRRSKPVRPHIARMFEGCAALMQETGKVGVGPPLHHSSCATNDMKCRHVHCTPHDSGGGHRAPVKRPYRRKFLHRFFFLFYDFSTGGAGDIEVALIGYAVTHDDGHCDFIARRRIERRCFRGAVGGRMLRAYRRLLQMGSGFRRVARRLMDTLRDVARAECRRRANDYATAIREQGAISTRYAFMRTAGMLWG